MAEIESNSAEKKLKGLLARVFADGVLEPSERAELTEMWRNGGLTVPQVRTVMTDFLNTTCKHVMADGVVTDAEREKLQTIVKELRLPSDCVPDQVKRVLT